MRDSFLINIFLVISTMAVNALVTPAATLTSSIPPFSDPGNILVIDGSPCVDCVPTTAQYSDTTPALPDENVVSTNSAVNKDAAQLVTTSSLQHVSLSSASLGSVTLIQSTGSASDSINPGGIFLPGETASATTTSNASKSSDVESAKPTPFNPIPEPTKPTPTSAHTTTSKSGAKEMATVNKVLRWSLAIYTISFTLLLLRVEIMEPLEFIVTFMGAAIGWTILFFDAVVDFISDPQTNATKMAKDFQDGLVMYLVERWNTYQLIRIRNPIIANYSASSKSNSRIFYREKSRLGPWWKSDILNSLKFHDLHDYFNPSHYSLERFHPITPHITAPHGTKHEAVGAPMKMRGLHFKNEDDIFSSDEELDISPLMAKRPRASNPLVLLRGPTSNPDMSGESKETCVNANMDPREKVSGFIPWNAMKRESEVGGREEEEGGARLQTERTSTDRSAGSWENEAMGAAI